MRSWLIKLILIIPLLVNVFVGRGQALVQSVMPADVKPGFTPREFYIAGVTDIRKGKHVDATLLQARAGKLPPELINANVQDGAGLAMQQFIQRNLPVNRALRAVIVKITALSINETPGQAGYAHGEISFACTFMLKRQADTVKLVNYAGGTAYVRSLSQPGMIGTAFGSTLMGSIAWFNNWINQQADDNILLAKAVEVTFTDYADKNEGDTIYYDPKRPLAWADFQSRPIDNRYDAGVMPGFGYSEDVKVSKGIIHAKFAIKTYVPKSASWAYEDRLSTYALNHEQRHFDIVKIITERYKHKLRSEKYTAENYDGPVGILYFDYFRLMNQMQKQYDTETRHGSNQVIQAEWDAKIDAELKQYGVK